MQAEAIYKGATRPAMKLGVPLVPLVVLAGSTLLIVIWCLALLSWWLALLALVPAAPSFVWMRWVTAHDDQRLRQMALAFRLRLGDHNRRFWGARSYSPHAYRGRCDARQT